MQDQNQLFCASVQAVTSKRERGSAPLTELSSAAQAQASPGPSRRKLAQEIRDFLAESGMYPTPFGIEAARDDKLLWRIERAPKGISLDKADRIRAFMADWRQSNGGHNDGHHLSGRKQKAQVK